MKRIVRNLTAYYMFLFSILSCFFVELMCINTLTGNFYELRHTGTEQAGLTFLVAEKMEPSMWQLVDQYMTDSEKVVWRDAYETDSEGCYVLKEDRKFSDTLNNLQETFYRPLAVAYTIYEMGDEKMQKLLTENELLAGDYMEIRDLIDEELDAASEKSVKNAVVSFLSLQLEQAGGDVSDNAKRYKVSCLIRILAAFIFMCLSAAGSIAICMRAEDVIRGRMVDVDMRRAQLLIFWEALTISEALLLIIFALYKMRRLNYMMLSLWGMGLLLIGLFVVWLIRTRPGFEGIYEGINVENHLKLYLKLVRILLLAGLPLFLLLVSGISNFRRSLAFALFGLAADLLLIGAGFLLPEIALMADGIDREFEPEENRD